VEIEVIAGEKETMKSRVEIQKYRIQERQEDRNIADRRGRKKEK
jgi:hypothetical protein